MFSWLISVVRIGLLFSLVIDLRHLEIKECKHVAMELQEGGKCWAWITDIRPSQFSLGEWETTETVKMLQQYSKSDLRHLKTSKPIPVNVAPSGEIFMYNRHHTIRGILDSSFIPQSEKWVYVQVKNNWSQIGGMNTFFRKLMEMEQIRLFDAKGVGPIDPYLLPKHVGELQNDPFRSLGSITKNYGCWKDNKTPFVEFIWGDFFRSKLQDRFLLYQMIHGDNKKWCQVRPYSSSCVFKETDLLTSLLPDALQLCNSKEAAHLPGYLPPDENVPWWIK